MRRIALPVVGIVRDVRDRRGADTPKDEPPPPAPAGDRTEKAPEGDAARGGGSDPGAR